MLLCAGKLRQTANATEFISRNIWLLQVLIFRKFCTFCLLFRTTCSCRTLVMPTYPHKSIHTLSHYKPLPVGYCLTYATQVRDSHTNNYEMPSPAVFSFLNSWCIGKLRNTLLCFCLYRFHTSVPVGVKSAKLSTTSFLWDWQIFLTQPWPRTAVTYYLYDCYRKAHITHRVVNIVMHCDSWLSKLHFLFHYERVKGVEFYCKKLITRITGNDIKWGIKIIEMQERQRERENKLNHSSCSIVVLLVANANHKNATKREDLNRSTKNARFYLLRRSFYAPRRIRTATG